LERRDRTMQRDYVLPSDYATTSNEHNARPRFNRVLIRLRIGHQKVAWKCRRPVAIGSGRHTAWKELPMKIIVFCFKPGVTMETIQPYLKEEVANVWRLWKAGIVRENYAPTFQG